MKGSGGENREQCGDYGLYEITNSIHLSPFNEAGVWSSHRILLCGTIPQKLTFSSFFCSFPFVSLFNLQSLLRLCRLGPSTF